VPWADAPHMSGSGKLGAGVLHKVLDPERKMEMFVNMLLIANPQAV